MLDFIKRNIFILIIFFTTLLLGFITFFTFLDKSFINLNQAKFKNTSICKYNFFNYFFYINF